MHCAKHDEETNVSCGRCETPLCAKCMVHTDVGVRCRNCAPDRGHPLYTMTRGRALLLGGIGLIFLIGLVGLFGGVGQSGSNDGLYGDYGDLPYKATMTIEQTVDPWVSDDGAVSPSSGHRFVAIEVTMQNAADGDIPYYLASADFKLTDKDGFAYGVTGGGARPILPAITLNGGEKARGWLTFEVNEEAEIVSLSDYFTTFDLNN